MAALPLVGLDPYMLHTLIMAGIFVIGAISLNLLLGYTGQLSLGHAAFFGLGAYASALLARLRYRPRLRPARQARAAAAGSASSPPSSSPGLGWLLGRLAFRLRGAYFVLLTICFARCVRMVALNWIELTNGPMALIGMPPVTLSLPGLGVLAAAYQGADYWLVLAVAVLAYLLCRQSCVAHRPGAGGAPGERDPRRVGRHRVTHYLVLAAVVSAGMAGAAGGLYAHYTRFVSPRSSCSPTP